MAFNGSLKEFGIVGLLQLPANNHLSGSLQIINGSDKVLFYFKNGALVHASIKDLVGRDALCEVIEWEDGTFSFDASLTTDDATVNEDLHHLIMWALKESDEKRNMSFEQEKNKSETLDNSLIARFSKGVYACIVNREGQVFAETSARSEFHDRIQARMRALEELAVLYPDDCFKKAFIDDTEFSIGLSRIETGKVFILFAESGVNMGVLAMELNKALSLLKAV